ncbi:MAG: exported protein of unknown function [Promethearchaeota archaeon]|nr:MAG: exported protein of unknown function [Candidatus Lokiarchaeota archaeon]
MKKNKYYVFALIALSSLIVMGMSQINKMELPNPKSIKLSSTESLSVVVQVDEFRVNSFTDFSQSGASISSLSDEKLVIVWQSNLQDGFGLGVYATIINASTGMNLTKEFRINQHTDGLQQVPKVCALSEDSFAVAWASSTQDPDGSLGVYMSFFNATTTQNITSETRVNDFINFSQSSPEICALSNNKLVVVWTSQSQDPDNSGGIYAKIFDTLTGINITKEFRINDYYQDNQANPSLCALSEDSFAVAWSSQNQDPDNSVGVYASVFNATTGNNITQEVRINHYSNDLQWYPSVGALSEDTFIISWQSEGQDPDGSYGIYATVFDKTEMTNQTIEFRVNKYTNDDQKSPSIASLSEDRVAIAWESQGQDPDGSYGVYSRVFFFNSPPEITNPSPSNGATNVDLNPTLEVDVSDANGHDLMIYFYDNSSDNPNLLGMDNIMDGGPSKASFDWNGLSYDTQYRWFVNVSDGLENTTSDEWQFTTIPNTPPSVGAESPSNGATNVDLNPILRVSVSDVNGQDLIIHFYDNTSGTPFALGFETVSSSEPEVVSLTWSDLEYNTEYKWFVNVSDGLVNTVSAQFSFTTKEEDMYIPGFLPMVFLPLTATIILIAGIYISRQMNKNE